MFYIYFMALSIEYTDNSGREEVVIIENQDTVDLHSLLNQGAIPLWTKTIYLRVQGIVQIYTVKQPEIVFYLERVSAWLGRNIEYQGHLSGSQFHAPEALK